MSSGSGGSRDEIRALVGQTLSLASRLLMDEAGVGDDQPCKLHATVVRRGGRTIVTGVWITDNDDVGPVTSPEMVGTMVLSELASIATHADKFVSVQMLVGQDEHGPEVHTIKVAPTDERPTLEPVNPTFGDLCALWEVVLAYRDKHEITCPETVHQTDKIAVTATEFVEDCLKVVGYGRIDDETDDYVGGNENRVPEGDA